MTRPHPPRTRFERHAANAVRQVRRTLAADLRSGREDAGISQRGLAAAAGVSDATIRAIERDAVEPSLQVVARVATALGMTLGVRLYPGTGPPIRDHIQAAMLTALLAILHGRWRGRPEVPVHRPVRGVIDLVLDAVREPLLACEAQSELRRLEQQLRWSRAKADALADGGVHDPSAILERRYATGSETSPAADGAPPGPVPPGGAVGRLLLLRSTVKTRAVVAQYADLVAAAYPARSRDAYAALTTEAPWPGDALLWCRVEGSRATVLVHPPRGIVVGR
jgi:transcriptional regulator with XRE-family HTH domain